MLFVYTGQPVRQGLHRRGDIHISHTAPRHERHRRAEQSDLRLHRRQVPRASARTDPHGTLHERYVLHLDRRARPAWLIRVLLPVRILRSRGPGLVPRELRKSDGGRRQNGRQDGHGVCGGLGRDAYGPAAGRGACAGHGGAGRGISISAGLWGQCARYWGWAVGVVELVPSEGREAAKQG